MISQIDGAFHKQARASDGLSPWCKGCRRLQQQNRYWRGDGKLIKQQYDQNNAKHIKEYSFARIRKPSTRYKFAVKFAKYRGLIFDISQCDYENLLSKTCYYCGLTVAGTGCGLDRLDNRLGYTIDNVVQCCKICNQARSDCLSPDKMLIVGQAIRQVMLARTIEVH